LTDHPKGRDQADAQSKKAQKALRLAKEATDQPAPAKKKPARSKTTLAG
jgi:hypothetical protein